MDHSQKMIEWRIELSLSVKILLHTSQILKLQRKNPRFIFQGAQPEISIAIYHLKVHQKIIVGQRELKKINIKNGLKNINYLNRNVSETFQKRV